MAANLTPLPPREAIAALFARSQRLEPSFAWQDVWQDTHASMFTVAKSAGFDILTDIHGGLERALAEGKTFRQFASELTPLLQQKGWWGRQPAFDPETGETKLAQLGSVRRLTTIFDVNMRVSYAAGHWSSFEKNKAARPFLRYVHLEGQAHPRPLHALWHNTVLPIEHPWWNTHACPNGWNCHCTLQSLSQRDIDRLKRQGEVLKFDPPPDAAISVINRRTGEVMEVPEGIDPGWAYNPGKAGFQALQATDRLAAAPADMAAEFNRDPDWLLKPIGPEFGEWFDRAQAGGRIDRSMVTVGALDDQVLAALRARDAEPVSGAITIQQTAVQHMLRDVKTGRGRAVPVDQLRRMPALLAAPRAVLLDKRNGGLLYVFDVEGDSRLGKLVVSVDFQRRLRPPGGTASTIVMNTVRSAGMVETRTLTDSNVYDVLSGFL